MNRQERRAVKQWIARAWPRINKSFLAKRTPFPTGDDVIRRYFDWCKRHCLPPLSERSMGYYWGLGTSDVGRVLSRITPALLEQYFGPSRPGHAEPGLYGQKLIPDAWWAHISVRVEREDDDDWSEEAWPIKIKANLFCQSSTFEFSSNESYSIHNSVRCVIPRRMSFRCKSRAHTEFKAKPDQQLQEFINDIAIVSYLDKRGETPSYRDKVVTHLQPITYRSRKRRNNSKTGGGYQS